MNRLISSDVFSDVLVVIIISSPYSCGVAALRGLPGGAELHQAGAIFIGRVRFVVPDPPFIRRRLRVAFRRVFPLLLAPERSDVEVVASVRHLLIPAIVNEVGAA